MKLPAPIQRGETDRAYVKLYTRFASLKTYIGIAYRPIRKGWTRDFHLPSPIYILFIFSLGYEEKEAHRPDDGPKSITNFEANKPTASGYIYIYRKRGRKKEKKSRTHSNDRKKENLVGVISRHRP